jgi:hypothetical protein
MSNIIRQAETVGASQLTVDLLIPVQRRGKGDRRWTGGEEGFRCACVAAAHAHPNHGGIPSGQSGEDW